MRFEEIFTATPDSAAAVRQFVRRNLPGDVDLDLVLLMVTELATNAVLHAGTPFAVIIDVGAAEVRFDVTDSDPTLPELVDRSDRDPGGRGLRIVDNGSASWGVEPSGTGKRVWFAVARPA